MNAKIGITVGAIVSAAVILSIFYFLTVDIESKEEITIENVESIVVESFVGAKTVHLDKNLLFTMYGIEGEDFIIKDGVRYWQKPIFELDPELSDLYDEIGVINDPQNTVVVLPIFTSSAYEEPGFYTYYKGECDSSCLTTEIKNFIRSEVSGNAVQVLKLLGYQVITDIDIDKNPGFLDEFDKVILLHSEYVTTKEFDAITNHPNVIYLYPNALYAKIEVNYDENTIMLIRGHNYPAHEIGNGFDWKFDNSQYEYDTDCLDMEFYRIDNGWMLNCTPVNVIPLSAELLKAIKEF